MQGRGCLLRPAHWTRTNGGAVSQGIPQIATHGFGEPGKPTDNIGMVSRDIVSLTRVRDEIIERLPLLFDSVAVPARDAGNTALGDTLRLETPPAGRLAVIPGGTVHRKVRMGKVQFPTPAPHRLKFRPGIKIKRFVRCSGSRSPQEKCSDVQPINRKPRLRGTGQSGQRGQ